MSDQAVDYDLLIAGGGMVGASMALAAASGGLRVGLLEARPWSSPGQPSYDDRSIALAEGSRRILADLDLWSQLADSASPIAQIHVSDRGHFGAVRLDAAEEGVAALGYVIENRCIGRALYTALAGSTVDSVAPARVIRVGQSDDRASVEIEADGARRTLSASMLIVADGANSGLREQLDISVRKHDYGQTAIIANLTAERPHRGRAFERFTADGPLAMLPLRGQRCALVLTLPTAAVDAWLEFDDAAFMTAVQARFGRRLGRFVKVGARVAYPLNLIESQPQTRGRVVLIGNAARTLHPVAGQGFNLALRDIVSLAEVLIRSRATLADVDLPQRLQGWAAARRSDQRITVAWTSALVQLFSNRLPPLGHARAAALVLLDLLAPARHALARRSMGLHGRRPWIRRLFAAPRA